MGKSATQKRARRSRLRTTEAIGQVGVQVEESEAQAAPAVEVPLDDSGFVEFAVAGTALAGEFRCADCGYGAVIQRVLPICPMCGGTVWEQRPHTPH